MKTYNEMATSALQKIEEHERIRKNRNIFITRTIVPILGLFLAVFIGISTWQFGIFERFSTPQHTLQYTPQHTPQNPITSSDNANTTANENNDIIIINKFDDISADKMNICLLLADFVELSASELNEYYGTKVFPAVPSDLTNWDKSDEFGGYGIYRRNQSKGDVYWDQNVLNYSNNDFTRNVNIEVAKNKLPVMDFGIEEKNIKKSTISGNDVYIGLSESGYYYAKFIYNNTGFVLTADGLSQEEVIAVIRSIVE